MRIAAPQKTSATVNTPKPPRTGALTRGAITGVAAARIGAVRLKRRLLPAAGTSDAQAQAKDRDDAQMGHILFQAMSQLRGSALKVSQLLSLDTGFLPAVMRRELAGACYQVMPLNRALIGKVFRQAFGKAPEVLFEQFEPVAFAAASLGQVHRAHLPGLGPVAVKVQYPGIAAAIPSDMQLLRHALKASGDMLPLPPQSVIDQVVSDIEATLLREVDYLQEAANLQWFAQHALLPGIVIPQVQMSHTRAQVLTQQHLSGQHLHAWLETAPNQAERDAQGQRMFDWFMHCAFELGHIHADLHPGNFLFMHDDVQGHQLGILDFGCTRILSPEFRRLVLDIWSAVLAPSSPERDAVLMQSCLRMGLIGPDISMQSFATDIMPALIPFQTWATEPFRRSHFDFASKGALTQPPPNHQKVFGRQVRGIPAELQAFDRAWLGLMHMLSRLGAQVCTDNPWLPIHRT